MAERLGHAHVGGRVDAGLHAVARDVGVHKMSEAERRHVARQLLGRHARALAPAGHGHLAALRVDARAKKPAVLRDGFLGEGGVGHERRAQHHARHARVGQARDGVERAHAPAHLHLEQGLAHDALDDGDVLGAPRPRTVEVHHVQPRRALLLEQLRLGGGVVVVHGHAVVIALGEADGLAAQDVDGRKQVHGAHAPFTMDTKLRSRRAPASELFSGWNCTPNATSPYWTALGNVTLCVVSPTTNGPDGATKPCVK